MPRDGFMNRFGLAPTPLATDTTTVRMTYGARDAFKSYAADHNMPMTHAIEDAAKGLREHSNLGDLHDRMATASLTITSLQKRLDSTVAQLSDLRTEYAVLDNEYANANQDLRAARTKLANLEARGFWRRVFNK